MLNKWINKFFKKSKNLKEFLCAAFAKTKFQVSDISLHGNRYTVQYMEVK